MLVKESDLELLLFISNFVILIISPSCVCSKFQRLPPCVIIELVSIQLGKFSASFDAHVSESILKSSEISCSLLSNLPLLFSSVMFPLFLLSNSHSFITFHFFTIRPCFDHFILK